MNTSEILTNKDIQWQYPKTFEPSVVVDDGSLNELSYIQKVWVTCLSDPCCWYFHLPAVVAVVHVRPRIQGFNLTTPLLLQRLGLLNMRSKNPTQNSGCGWGGCKDSAAIIRFTIDRFLSTWKTTSVEIGFLKHRLRNVSLRSGEYFTGWKIAETMSISAEAARSSTLFSPSKLLGRKIRCRNLFGTWDWATCQWVLGYTSQRRAMKHTQKWIADPTLCPT